MYFQHKTAFKSEKCLGLFRQLYVAKSLSLGGCDLPIPKADLIPRFQEVLLTRSIKAILFSEVIPFIPGFELNRKFGRVVM